MNYALNVPTLIISVFNKTTKLPGTENRAYRDRSRCAGTGMASCHVSSPQTSGAGRRPTGTGWPSSRPGQP